MSVQNTGNQNTVPFLRGLTSSLKEDDGSIIQQIPATAGTLLTGDASLNLAGLQAVTDGEFKISINGIAYNVIGLDFSATASLADVATVLQTNLDALVTGFTVSYGAPAFTFTSPELGANSSVTFLSSTGSGTDVSGAGFLEGQSGDGGTVTAGTGRTNPMLFGTVLSKDPLTSKWGPLTDVALTDGLEYPRGILLCEIPASDLLAGDVVDVPILVKGDVDIKQVVLENGLSLTSVITSNNVQVNDFLREIGIYTIGTINIEEYQPLN